MSEQTIYQVFDDYEQAYQVAAHYELMNDFKSLVSYTEWNQSYSFWSDLSASTIVARFSSNVSYDAQVSSMIPIFFPPQRFTNYRDYIERLATTCPFNVYKSAINSVIGLMSRKDINFTNEEEIKDKTWLVDLDGKANSLQSIANCQIFPAIMGGIGAIHVDYIGDRVVWNIFKATEISRKHMTKDYVEGREVYKRIVIVTCDKEEDPETEFKYKQYKKALCLKLINKSDLPDFIKGDYVRVGNSEKINEMVAVWEIYKDEQDIDKKDEETDTRDDYGVYRNKSGEVFDELPCYIFKTEDCSPPFFSAAKKSFNQANMESELEQSLKKAIMYMIYVKSQQQLPMDSDINESTTGSTKQGFKIADNSVFELEQGDDMGIVEAEGNIYKITVEYLDRLITQITAMVVSKLSDQSTARTKAQYEGEQMTNTTVILSIVDECQKAIQQALTASNFFMGLNDDQILIAKLNRDFVKEIVDGNFAREIKEMWMDRMISHQTAINTLKQKEMLPQDVDSEQEIARIGEEESLLGTEPANND